MMLVLPIFSSAWSVLVDLDGYAVTGRIVLDQFRIRVDQTTSIEVDFPGDNGGGEGGAAGDSGS